MQQDFLSVKEATEILIKEGIVKNEQSTRRYIRQGSLSAIAPPANKPQIGHKIKTIDLYAFIHVMKMDRSKLIREYIKLTRHPETK